MRFWWTAGPCSFLGSQAIAPAVARGQGRMVGSRRGDHVHRLGWEANRTGGWGRQRARAQQGGCGRPQAAPPGSVDRVWTMCGTPLEGSVSEGV